jgi:hypothetical protein
LTSLKKLVMGGSARHLVHTTAIKSAEDRFDHPDAVCERAVSRSVYMHVVMEARKKRRSKNKRGCSISYQCVY